MTTRRMDALKAGTMTISGTLTFTADSPKPIVGTNDGGPWATVSDATGGLAAFRGYNTPKAAVPKTWPGPDVGNIPVGTDQIISIKPPVEDVLSGSLDGALATYVKQAPPGARLTAWHEGEGGRFGYTGAQLCGMHQRIFDIVRKVAPGVLYGQIFQTYSATVNRVTAWTARGLHWYGIDSYPAAITETPETGMGVLIAQIEAAGVIGPWLITESNVTASNGAPVSSLAPADWFNRSYAYAKSINAEAYLTYWNPALAGLVWPPAPDAVNALSAITVDSRYLALQGRILLES